MEHVAKRVLVTGGAGFIGSHTVVTLIEQGYKPAIVDTFANSSPEVLERIRALTGEQVTAYNVDVRNTDALHEILTDEGFDSVIHFAALKAVGESVERPLDYYDLNVGGTISLLRSIRKTQVRNLVFSGSCSIFGDTDRSPLDEEELIAPANPYARTKAVCETILADACAIDDTLSATTLRYFNPIGAHSSGRLGEDPLGVPNNLLPYAMQVAVGRRENLQVFGDDYPTPDGSCVRDYVHVMDLAAAHVRALEVLDRDAGYRSLNLGTGRGTSVHELVQQVRDVTGHPVPTIICPRRDGDVPVLVADPSLARKILGWRCTFDTHDMISHAWKFQRTNPDGYGRSSASGDAL